MNIRLVVIGAVFLGLASLSLANAQPSDEIKAELEQGLAAQHRGLQEQANIHFERLLAIYNASGELSSQDLAAIATAASYIGATEPQLYKDAVRVYDEAIAKDPGNLDARVAQGNLLLDKYNNTEALEVFQEALSINPEHPAALLGLARSQHFDHSSEALQTVTKSLELDPEAVPARSFLTRLLIELEQYEDAAKEAHAALERDPESLETLAVLATVHYLTGDEAAFQETTKKVLTLNPVYAELYNTLAELASRNRLYTDSVDFAKQAVATDPQSWRGYGLLGTNQLRTGEIDEAIANLEKSFAGDPYNVWIKNMLDLVDTFPEYELVRSEHFEVLVHRDEAALLTPYILDVAERAYANYSQRYNFQPKLPIRAEFYPRHADFSVRTVGLAGIGILGVAFGPLVAMDSPSARQVGSFNWGSTLWHELAHTFHLGMSDNRVPRWFAEGFAVLEERKGRPGWGGDVTPDFLQAYNEDKLLPVSELNNGFVRPSYPQQVIHSYYQASLVLEFIEREWGFDALLKMLDGYKQRLSNTEVIEQTLGIEIADLDQAFDNDFRRRFAQPLSALSPLRKMMEMAGTPDDLVRRAYWETDNYNLQLQAGQYLLSKDDPGRAERFLKRAQELFPDYADQDSPYWLLAQIYERKGALTQAIEQLRLMTAINGEHYGAHVKLAELRRVFGDTRGAAEALESALYIHPFAIDLHERLAQLYTEMADWPTAARERRAVVALAPVDMSEARFQLANALFKGGNLTSARYELLRALETAPNFEQGLELLLEIRAQRESG